MAVPTGVSGSHPLVITAAGPPSTAPTRLHSPALEPPRGRCSHSNVGRVVLPPAHTTASARAAGLTRAQLRGPRFVRLAHDSVVPVDDAIDPRERLPLLVGLLPTDAAYSHGTAAALLGTHVDMPVRAHVAMTPRRVLPQRAEFVVHTRRLAEEDVVVHYGLRTTSGPQTWLDLAERLPPHELVAVGDALMRGGHLPTEALARRLGRATRVPGVVSARRCAPLLTPLSMSRPESLVRYRLVSSDLPDPQPQVPVRDRWDRVVAHGDLGYARWGVLLEYAGRQHAGVEQFARDIDRYPLMTADGWLVLRFAARHAEFPAVVVDRTRRALRSRGGRPGLP